MRESSIEQKLVRGLRARGWRAVKFVSPGNDGMPDRLVLGPLGRVIFVELKTETGRLSAVQSAQIAKLRRLGQDVRVLYGKKGVEDFIQEVAGLAIHTARLSAPGD